MTKLYYIRKTNNELLSFGEFESGFSALVHLACSDNSFPCGRYLLVGNEYIEQVSLKEKSSSLYLEDNWKINEGNILTK